MGHPRGLVVLFFTEMWERFSFYGMRAMLTIYLIQHFLFGPVEAQGIYAAYGALVYLLPVVGGLIADKYLGSRKAVIIGAVLLVAGHFTMAFEGAGAREFITIGSAEYAIEVEGRNIDRQLYALTESGRVPIAITPEGVTVVDVAGQPAGSGATAATAAAFPA
ncbi:MAG: MFS transporter, partial [Brevundimonas sp.]|nr:MFS transporter [Brevundimonas sp.]